MQFPTRFAVHCGHYYSVNPYERMILSLAARRPHAFPPLSLDVDQENRTEDKLETQRYHILEEGMRSSRISHLSLVHPKFNGRRDVRLMPPLN